MMSAGVDLGGKRSRVHVRDAEGKAIYAGWAMSLQDVVTQLSPWGKDVSVAFEATSQAFYLCDLLEGRVGEVKVAHPRDLRAIAHARIKNDRLDAEKLSELNRGGLIPAVWVPPTKTRDARELLHEQARTQSAAQKEKVKIRSLLRRWGQLSVSNVLDLPRGVQLPPGASFTLGRKQAHLKWLIESEKELSREIRRQVPMGDREQWLCTIPGVGTRTARWLSNTLGDVARFPDARHVASYFGLVPSERSSGGTVRRGGITKEGNVMARRLLIQCAWAAIRATKKDASGRWRAMYTRLIDRGKSKGRAIVAVANHLCRVAYALLRDQRPYNVKTSKESNTQKHDAKIEPVPIPIVP